MDFASALIYLKAMEVVKRESWGRKHLRLSENFQHILFVGDVGEEKVWEPRQEDILANDWSYEITEPEGSG